MAKLQSGVVKTWRDDKGFGFIDTEQGDSVFFHISDYKPQRRPELGDKVVFKMAQGDKGRPKATQVQDFKLVQRHVQQKARRKRNTEHQRAFKSTQSNRLFIAIAFYAVLLIIAIMGRLHWLVVGWYLLIGLITFLVYAKDKSAAQNGKWRTPESTLHTLSLIGGWVGAMLAQTYLRHKSKKADFRTVYYLTVIINFAGLLFVLAGGDLHRFL